MRKRILSVILAFALVLGICPVTGYAQTGDAVLSDGNMQSDVWSDVAEGNVTYGTGLLPLEAVEVELDGEPSCGVVESVDAREESEWDKYANWYYYNQMNEAEQAFYDKLDATAYSYLTGSGNVNGAKSGYSDWISYSSLSLNHAVIVYWIFRYANPQYYFISNAYMYSSGSSYFSFGVYPAFVSGTGRSTATAAFKNSIESALESVNAAKDDEGRVQAAHDWIVNKMVYGSTTSEEATSYTQSAYSTFCLDKTVCSGYAQAFSLLCNAVGINAICVTSLGHGWNKVQLYGNWYQVDCTWDDPVSSSGKQYLLYNYFDRSDAYVMSVDSDKAHEDEAYYAQYNVPKASYDSVGEEDSYGDRWSPGVISLTNKITKKTATPVISAKTTGTQTTITLSCATAGTPVYYYTLNGTTPSVAGSKAIRASGNTVTYTGNATFKVIAIVDGYLESEAASYTTVLPKYTVSFNSQGGSAVAAQTIQVGEQVKSPATPTRKGYTFVGWYKDSKCTTEWNFALDRVSGNTTIYAKWSAVNYKITYYLNKGTNHKSNINKYTVATKTFTLKSPTRKGYIFKGWYSDSKFKTKVTKIKVGSTGNLKLYAKWEKVTAPKKTGIKSLVNKKTKKMVVQVQKVSGADGYQIRYSTNSNMKSAKTVASKSLSATITKLTKGKKYYVQVRAYKLDSKGNKVTGSWSNKKSVTIRK